MYFYGATDTPVLDFGDVSCDFHSHSGQQYSHLASKEAYVITLGVKCPTFSYFLGFVLLFPTFR